MNRSRFCRTDSRYGHEVGRLCKQNVAKTAEVAQHGPSCDCRDASGRGQSALRWRRRSSALRPLRVGRPVGRSCVHTSLANPADPLRRLDWISAREHGGSQVVDRKQQATNGFRGEWPVVRRRSLDQQVRPATRASQLGHLKPEAPLDHGEVQVPDSLAFKNRQLVEHVVAGPQGSNIHLEPESHQLVRDAACALVNVDKDAQAPSVHANPKAHRANCVNKMSPSDFAGV